MIDTAKPRNAILARVRSAQRPPTAGEQRNATAISPGGVLPDPYSTIERSYICADAFNEEQRISLFEERLREYDAGVYRTTLTLLPDVIAQVLAARNKRQVAVPEGVPSAWLASPALFVTDADTSSAHELDKLDGVLTACTLAIALTGTIVLQNAPAQGPRMMTLVPDYHLCIVFAHQLVGTVPEAFDRLEATRTLPTTFISGPSATADIEMTRIKGVHGPRFLDVILVFEPTDTDSHLTADISPQSG